MHRKLTLKAVEAQIRKLEAQAKMLKEAEKPGMAELKAVIAKFKLAPADIKAAMKAPRSKGARRSMAKGNKLKAKYRNPAKRSETWAGHGLKPKWLSSLIAKGKKLEDFAGIGARQRSLRASCPWQSTCSAISACDLPDPAKVRIDAAYVEANMPIVGEQLQKAGVRLARLLDAA